MKIGLIGDVHAEDRLLDVGLRRLCDAGVSTVVCVGDIVDGAGSVDRCVDLLMSHAVQCVRGNHDDWFLRGMLRDLPGASRVEDVDPASCTWLAALPATLELDTPDGMLLLCHGLGSNNMARLNEDDFDFPYTIDNHRELQDIFRARRYAFVVGGHSHQVFLRTTGGVTFVKAGTLKRNHAPGVAILDTAQPGLDWIALDPAAA